MCRLCKTKPVYQFTNKRTLCSACFTKYFQKKFLFINRKFELIKSGDKIGYENKGDFRGVVLEHLLKMFEPKLYIELIKLPTKKKTTKLAIPSTTDLEAEQILKILIKDKSKGLKKVAPIDSKKIKPLYLFTDKEVLLYAKLKKLRFKKQTEKKDNISDFINNLEKNHPEVKRAMVNSYLKLSELQ